MLRIPFSKLPLIKPEIRKTLVYLFFFLFSCFCFPASGYAACVSPAGNAADMVYNSDSHVYQYCNGASWRAMGRVQGAGGSGCTSPTGNDGDMIYNSDYHVYQYCDGANWRAMGGGSFFPNGIVGWWKLDEGAGTSAADSSGRGNTGTLINTPTWTSSGEINGALTFLAASSQYVNVPDAPSLDVVGSWTVSTWVNPTTVPGAGGKKVLAKDDASNNSNYGIALVNGINGCASLGWRIYFDPGGNVCYVTTINPGTWYHVVGEWDSVGQNLMIYLNGALVATQHIPGGVPTSASGGALELGNEPGISAYLNGTLDDVRVYNRALSASEIAKLYNAAGGAKCSSPAGNEGDMIYNSASNVMQYCNGTNWVGFGH